MKEISCFRLDTIGEDSYSLAARFSSLKAAEDAKPAAGGYGGRVTPEKIVIYDTAAEWRAELDQEAITTGLSKLSEREKRALGLAK